MSDRDNKSIRQNGISVRTMQMLITIITLVISAVLLVATYRMANDYRALKIETDEFIQLTESSNELMNASDYLTEQVRLFAETGEREYMDNYFKEANEYKRREKALEKLDELAGEGAAYQALNAALNESVNLMNREYYSMRLTSDAYGLKKGELPESVKAINLKSEDAALDNDAKEAMGRRYVFDNNYQKSKDIIRANMTYCLDMLHEDLEKSQNESSKDFEKILFRQRVLILIAISIILLSILFTLLYLVSPLLRAVVHIKADNTIPIMGSKEFRFLARAYNLMYEKNKQKTEQLTYKARHDHLTGLYNRSAYDFYIQNVELDDTALLIIDVDDFKKYNDEYGHEVGDKVLCKVADAINGVFRTKDYVCRLGGDEFTVIVTHIDRKELGVITNKIGLINNTLTDTSDGLPEIHISVGIAYGEGKTGEELFRAADDALYEVKSSGKGGYIISEK